MKKFDWVKKQVKKTFSLPKKNRRKIVSTIFLTKKSTPPSAACGGTGVGNQLGPEVQQS